VKCTLPFSEVFKVDPEIPLPPRDFGKYFESLREGITGKEILEESVSM
jgi:hypothetical protein